jgi:hypothetical protein
MDIAAVRDGLALAIADAGIDTVYTYVPARPIPNCAIIEPDTDFITVYEGQYKPDYASNWKVQLVVRAASNDMETSALDNILNDVVPGIWENTDVTRLSVDKPFILEVNGANFLATNINISIDMQGGN